MPPKEPLRFSRLGGPIILGFFFLAPLITFVLLTLRGLPDFASAHLWDVLVWTYGVTWLTALLSGIAVSGVVWRILGRTNYFHHPYDFGRSFSLGAILGALAEGGTTGLYRALFHRPFSAFWVAGAMMSGCLCGAVIIAVVLKRINSLRV